MQDVPLKFLCGGVKFTSYNILKPRNPKPTTPLRTLQTARTHSRGVSQYRRLISKHKLQIFNTLRVRVLALGRLRPAEGLLHERSLALLDLEDTAFDSVFNLIIGY